LRNVDEMRVVIIGGHGKIARLLGELLVERQDEVVGVVRNADHIAELAEEGIVGYHLDLEKAGADDLVPVLAKVDAAVFAAGAGPGSGLQRKDTVDRAAAVLLADAAERAGVRRVIQVSAMGLDRVADGATPGGMDSVFVAYLRAKLAAEQDLRSRAALDWTILRPGRLTDDPGTGRVSLAQRAPYGQIPRADVAAVLLGLLDRPGTAGRVLEVVSGDVPVTEALAALG
jgi:nucleoside-diphosphate-sugar epimerase